MKIYTLFLVLLFSSCAVLSTNSAQKEIVEFQKEINDLYKNKEESPLRGADFDQFESLPFFPSDLKYRVEADFTRTTDAVPFKMPTSSGQTKDYVAFGTAKFLLNGNEYELTIYQSLYLRELDNYKNSLFLPFRDETNGSETYGGGRYIDLKIPKGDKITIDFNQAYNPYCAYNGTDYSCPIVPYQNTLETEILAGVKYDSTNHH